MPCYVRMKGTFLRGILWLYLFGFGFMSLALEPGYLDFDNLPDTNFSCVGKVIGGYYADLETNCQMFHVCTIGQLDEPMDIRFLCLNGTVFDQETRVCERIDEVDCTKSEQFYSLNLELYGNTQAAILEESPDAQETEQPLIIRSTTTTTTTTTTTPHPLSKTTPIPFYTTVTPPTVTHSSGHQVVSTHHFPVVNSPDIRFNPEEINISLNPGAPPDIRTKPLSFQSQSFSDSNKVVVTTHTTVEKDEGESDVQVLPNQRLERPQAVPITQKPKTVYAANKNIPHTTPSEINYNLNYHKPSSERNTEAPHDVYFRSNLGFHHSQSYPAHISHHQQQQIHTTSDKTNNYQQRSSSTTAKTLYFHALRPSASHQQQQIDKPPQRLQIPLTGLPTLPPLTFSTPAPFALQRHIETKRYTKDHQAPPPRIIISASASVSDASGRRLNYSLGTIGAAEILETPPSSYDEYKDSDVGLDPFYHDVPKVKERKKRSVSETKINPFDIIKTEKEAVDVLEFLFDWYKKHQATATVPPVTIPIPSELITKINNELAPVELSLATESSEVSYSTSNDFTTSSIHVKNDSDTENAKNELFIKSSKFNILGGTGEIDPGEIQNPKKEEKLDIKLDGEKYHLTTVVSVNKDTNNKHSFNVYDYVNDNYEPIVYKATTMPSTATQKKEEERSNEEKNRLSIVKNSFDDSSNDTTLLDNKNPGKVDKDQEKKFTIYSEINESNLKNESFSLTSTTEAPKPKRKNRGRHRYSKGNRNPETTRRRNRVKTIKEQKPDSEVSHKEPHLNSYERVNYERDSLRGINKLTTSANSVPRDIEELTTISSFEQTPRTLSYITNLENGVKTNLVTERYFEGSKNTIYPENDESNSPSIREYIYSTSNMTTTTTEQSFNGVSQNQFLYAAVKREESFGENKNTVNYTASKKSENYDAVDTNIDEFDSDETSYTKNHSFTKFEPNELIRYDKESENPDNKATSSTEASYIEAFNKENIYNPISEDNHATTTTEKLKSQKRGRGRYRFSDEYPDKYKYEKLKKEVQDTYVEASSYNDGTNRNIHIKTSEHTTPELINIFDQPSKNIEEHFSIRTIDEQHSTNNPIEISNTHETKTTTDTVHVTDFTQTSRYVSLNDNEFPTTTEQQYIKPERYLETTTTEKEQVPAKPILDNVPNTEKEDYRGQTGSQDLSVLTTEVSILPIYHRTPETISQSEGYTDIPTLSPNLEPPVKLEKADNESRKNHSLKNQEANTQATEPENIVVTTVKENTPDISTISYSNDDDRTKSILGSSETDPEITNVTPMYKHIITTSTSKYDEHISDYKPPKKIPTNNNRQRGRTIFLKYLTDEIASRLAENVVSRAPVIDTTQTSPINNFRYTEHFTTTNPSFTEEVTNYNDNNNPNIFEKEQKADSVLESTTDKLETSTGLTRNNSPQNVDLTSSSPSTMLVTKSLEDLVKDIEITTKSIAALDNHMKDASTRACLVNGNTNSRYKIPFEPELTTQTDNIARSPELETTTVNNLNKNNNYHLEGISVDTTTEGVLAELVTSTPNNEFRKEDSVDKTLTDLSESDSSSSDTSKPRKDQTVTISPEKNKESSTTTAFEFSTSLVSEEETTPSESLATNLFTTQLLDTTSEEPKVRRAKNRRTRPTSRQTNKNNYYGRHRFKSESFTATSGLPNDIRQVQRIGKSHQEEFSTHAPFYKSVNPTQDVNKDYVHTTPLTRINGFQKNRRKLSHYVFNCFGKDINKFYADPRDCRLFHYCTQGYSKNQLLDMKFVCDLDTFFDDEKLICTKVKPKRCL